MRRADQIGGVLLLMFGAGYAAVARGYPYSTPYGPGSGFMPLWLGVGMLVLALLLLIGASRRGAADGSWLPDRTGLFKLAITLLATVLFVALMDQVGMILGSALFLVGILRFSERYPWGQVLAIAAGVGTMNYLVFTYWLRVPFPVGILGF